MTSSHDDPRRRLFTRHPENPILTAHDWPYFVNTVFNPAAVRLPTGETLLLCRVEDCSGRSHLSAARSADGATGWRIDATPTLAPDPAQYSEEIWGIEDPRIVWVEELDRYAVTYTAWSREGPGVSLALTRDFRAFERHGMLMHPDDKDATLLPRRIDGRWAMIHRPSPPNAPRHIYMSFSPDLKHWGDRRPILLARQGGWWDAHKIGLSPPLVETPEGWLLLYHGVRTTAGGCLYRLGLALLDLENPTKCIRRGTKWIMGPEVPYERTGDVGGVVFPCGYTRDEDVLHLYYGAADTSIGLASGSIRALLDWLWENGADADYGVS